MSGLTSVNEVTTPSAPASGSRRIYPTAAGWTDMDSAGNTYLLGQISGMTAGYVAFGGTTTPLAASPSLFWDNTNKWLGVGAGIVTPVSVLDVTVDAGITPTYPGPVFSRHISATNAMQLVMRKSRNTRASPQAILANDAISNLLSYGHDGSNYVAGGQILVRAAENWVASTTLGSQMEFYTSAPGSSGQRLGLILYANRGMTVGANAVFSDGGLHYLSGALTAGTVNYAIGLYQDTALTAHANSDTLSMVQIAQTFAKSTFTGLITYGMRIYGGGAPSGAGTIAQNSLLNILENTYGTANVGLLIGTHPGGSTNYAIYSDSTNASLFSGNLGIRTTAARFRMTRNTSALTLDAIWYGEDTAPGTAAGDFLWISGSAGVQLYAGSAGVRLARFASATPSTAIIDGTITAVPLTARTNTAESVLQLYHRTSGTAAAGFGVAVQKLGETSDGTDQTMAYWNTAWNTATTGSRKAQTDFYVYDTAGRLALSIAADGAAANIGFFGTAPAAKQTVTGSRAANAALASLLTGLANMGLITNSSSA